jgi:hypothetical protein
MTPCRDGNRNRSCDGTARGVVELVMACIRNLVPQSQPEAIRVGALAKDEYHRAVNSPTALHRISHCLLGQSSELFCGFVPPEAWSIW